jgi:N-acetylglutamate synthase-like GNAT family acetyltransferase
MSDKGMIEISSDRNRMDISLIHDFLTRTYWAEGRSVSQVRRSIEHSIPFGLFLNETQIAFARVVSDQTVFAYLMDVFVVPEQQGFGYAQRLLKHIMSRPEFSSVGTWMLKTRDAHGLYEKLGFQQVDEPELWMVKTG